MAYNKQIRQLPADIVVRECGLIELGRMHARNFDAGHSPSGGGVQRVLSELRRLKIQEDRATAKALADQPTELAKSDLDDLRARRAHRTATG